MKSFCGGRFLDLGRPHLTALLAVVLVGQGVTIAIAQSGACTVEVNVSNSSGFLDASLVDAATLETISACPEANDAGEYAVNGLVVIAGDAANPLGNFQVSGQLGQRLEAGVTVDRPNAALAATASDLFVSLLVGTELSTFPIEDGDAFILGDSLEAVTRDKSGPQPDTIIASVNAFAETSDGFSTNVAGAFLSGVLDVAGVLSLETSFVDAPPLPSGTTETGFSFLTAQLDLGFFNVSPDGEFTVEATSRFDLAPAGGLPGDFNNDGVVNAADYTVWRDGLGSEFTLGDYDRWTGNFGSSQGAKGVPEPGGLALACLSFGAWLSRRCRKSAP